MDDTKTQNIDFKEKIIGKIKAGEVSMRPKIYFLAKIYLLVFIMFFIFLISALLVSYMLFSLYAGGQVFLLGFGTEGLLRFVLMFPWFLLAINVGLLLLLDAFLKRFRFAYNRPILYVFLATLVFITLVGSLVNLTSFHRNMMYRAENKHLPMFGVLYYDLRKSHKESGIFRGTVSSISSSTFTIHYNDNDDSTPDSELTLFIRPNVQINRIAGPGDEVFVAGDIIDGRIYAYGVKRLGISQ